MRWIFPLVILLFITTLSAQVRNFGVPFIQSFPKKVYQGAPSNWQIDQDESGVMYFANNKGMLQHNGNDWQIFRLPNRTITRSLAVGKDGNIYVGGQNEVGYFTPNKNGKWSFVSLRELIPVAARSFEDVWSIEILGDAVFFYASDNVYCYQNGKITVFVGQNITFLGKANGQLFLQQTGQGIFRVDTNGLHWIAGSELLKDALVAGIVHIKDKILFTTFKEGIFAFEEDKFSLFQSEATDFLKEQRVKCVTALPQNRIAVGTEFGGILILDAQGRVDYRVSKTDGLLSNRVLSLFVDRHKNLWLGLDKGINYLEINSPFMRIFPDGEQAGAGFSTKIFAGQIYFSTANGLYTTPWKDRYSPLQTTEFKLVENSKGQAWRLDLIDNQLFMAHHRGAFQIEKNQANLITDANGIWRFHAIAEEPNKLLAGSYNDIFLLENNGANWQGVKELGALEESCRFLERDKYGNFWVAHPYKGVFKITPATDFQSVEVMNFDTTHGLTSTLHNHLFKIKNDIIFCAERGVYLYDENTNRFVPSEAYNNIFGTDTKVRRLYETPTGNIWYITENELGKIEVRDNGLERQFSKIVFPDLSQNLNQGFEEIYAFDEDNLFITNDQGFLYYHPQPTEVDSITEKLVFTTVKLTTHSDSILYAGAASPQSQHIELKHFQDAIYFEFSITDYQRNDDWKYRYNLEGEGSDWSDWSVTAYKEYNHLKPGDYEFQVQARHADGRESETAVFVFTIQSPWYWSPISRLFYAFVLLSTIFLLIFRYQRKYRSLQAENEQVIQNTQQAIEQIQAEKNKAELEFKQRELVSATMHIVQKNERLQDIKTRLVELQKKSAEPKIAKEIRTLVRNLQQDEVLDDGWEQFMLHFNQLHGNFTDRLQKEFPKLTPKDLKLCAYLRLNLSTKEMASLMNITVRGVEASRYRLRKKFDLPPESNLITFLLEFQRKVGADE
ncbi:MAG: triple tyrosine motif-containing protein [Saprospiraceae bacterium]